MKNKLFVVSIFLLLLSCGVDKEQDDIVLPIDEDYLVFGNIHSECIGDCRNLYLLTREELYEDSNNPSNEQVTFNPVALPATLFEAASKLWEPPTALSSNSVNPDAIMQRIADYDHFIEGEIHGNSFRLLYDGIDSLLQAELFEYTIKIESVVNEID